MNDVANDRMAKDRSIHAGAFNRSLGRNGAEIDGRHIFQRPTKTSNSGPRGAGDDNGIEEDEVASQCCLDIEEEDQMVGGEITDQLLLMHDPPGLKSHHHHHRDQYLEAMPMMCDGLAADEDPPTFCYPHSPLQDSLGLL